MKKIFILLLLVVGGFFAYDKYEVEIKKWFEPTESGAEESEWDREPIDHPPIEDPVETKKLEEPIIATPQDQLFAVMSKRIIEEERYIARTETNTVGRPVTKINPTIFTIRCLGRETRKEHHFIVDEETYYSIRPKDKLAKGKLSGFESFPSAKKLRKTVDQRREEKKDKS